jgi:uncharacterized protein (TIGR02145 family)
MIAKYLKARWDVYLVFVCFGMLLVQCNNGEVVDEFCEDANMTASIALDSNALKVSVLRGSPPYYYEWSDGGNQSVRPVFINQVYSLRVYDRFGCVATASINLTNIDFCEDSNFSTTIAESNGTLIAIVSGGQAPYFYSWSTGGTSSSVPIPGQGIFTLQVTDVFGCIAEASISVDPCDGQTSASVGAVTYDVVAIGNQCWTVQSMRHDVPGLFFNQFTNQQWANRTSPTACSVNSDPSNDAVYGRLYNWWAVNLSTFCPSGWRVPSQNEYNSLGQALGGSSIAGGALKATTGWAGANVGATNSSGFTALPGGLRTEAGVFSGFETSASFWGRSNFAGSQEALAMDLSNANTNFELSYRSFKQGRCVRCIKI